MSKCDEETLDAYGHLNWTIGNEDWIACLDAIRKGSTIEYHVVVDCESGGFTDTVETGSVEVTDAAGIEHLKALPYRCADMAFEAVQPQREDDGLVEYEETAQTWVKHIDRLLSG